MTAPSSKSAPGYLSVVTAAILWATSGVAGKSLFVDGITPLALVQIRATLAAVVLFAALAVRAPALLVVERRDLPRLAALGGVGLALVQASYFYAISLIPVAAAILLQYLAPVFIAAFAMAWWGERATPAKLTALGLAVGGSFLVAGGYTLDFAGMNPLGVGVGLAAAVFFAGYTLFGERLMHRYSPWTVLAYGLAFAAASLHVLHPPFSYLWAGYSLGQWGIIAYVAVAGTVLPFGLYFVGVSHIRSTRASIIATLEPITAGALAFAVLGEALTGPQVVGGAAVLGAVVLLNLRREEGVLAPAAIRAGHGPAAGSDR